MSYRITTYEALCASLSAAGTMLCRANIDRLHLSEKERPMLCSGSRSDRRA